MLKVTVTGAQNGANTTFTLSQAAAAGGVTFFFVRGLLQHVTTAALTSGECSVNGVTVTLGLAPVAADVLTAYVQTSVAKGLGDAGIVGAQNSVNTSFTIATAPPAGSSLLLFHNGLSLTQVVGAPAADEFSLVGTVVTVGLAPATLDVLQGYVEENAAVFFHVLTMAGLRNGANTIFTTTSATLSGFMPNLMIFLNGQLQVLSTTTLAPTQYLQTSVNNTVTVRMGIAPTDTNLFTTYLVGSTAVQDLTTSLLNLRSLERRLIVLMNGQVDAREAEMCLDEQWRMLLSQRVFAFMKASGTLSTVASRNTGTLTLSQGSVLVLGSGTTPSTADIGKAFLLNNQPYRVIDVDVAAEVYILDAPYTGVSGAGQSYTLYQNRYMLSPDVVRVLTWADANWQLEQRSQVFFDALDPGRTVFGEPIYYAYINRTPGGIQQVELWPNPDRAYLLRYVGLQRSALATATQIIPDVSDVLLKFGAQMAAGIIANKMATAEKWEGASHWQNQAQDWQQQAEIGLQRFIKQHNKVFQRNQRLGTWPSYAGRTDIDFSPFWGH